jgi:hypothetical protein
MAIIKIGNPAIDLDAAEIPNLSANKITSDTLADARVPDLNTSKITAGTLSDARLPANALNSNIDLTNLSASNLTSGTVATARLGSGTANSSTFLRGDNTFASAGGENTPAFQVLLSSSQLINNNTNTVIAFDTEIFDTDNAVSNGVFTVPSGKAGKYFFAVNGGVIRGQDINVNLWLSKNNQTTIATTSGWAIAVEYRHLGSSNSIQVYSVSGTFDLAVGDSVKVYLYHSAANSTDSTDKGRFTFSGHKLI